MPDLPETPDTIKDHDSLATDLERLRDEHNRALAEKEVAIARLEDELYRSKKQAKQIQEELEEMKKGKAWKLALGLRMLRLVIAPPNSPMEKILGLTNRQVQSEEIVIGSRHDPARLAPLKQQHRTRACGRLAEFLGRQETFFLRQSPNPDLTILLVLYNQAELTYACLRSLMTELGDRSEILIVDNASSDETAELLARVEGLRMIRNEENAGFIRAVNQGVQAAQGKYVLLLNNDTQLAHGSIDQAMALMEGSPDIGAVGGRVLLLDGFLQEAGSLVWNEGSAAGYARGRHAQLDEVMFRRDVDFCSGVFLLTRRDLFLKLGGFDLRFAPAYYEDADYCLRLWKAGYRVVYDPNVVIEHFEYGSAGMSEKALEQIQRNRGIFFEKHARALEDHYPPGEKHLLFARARRPRKGRILFVDDLAPLPYHGAGLPRSRMMLQILNEEGYFVTVYPMIRSEDRWEDIYRFLPQEVEVMLNYNAERIERFLESRCGYYDILLVSRPHNARMLHKLHEKHPELFEGMYIIYDAEAIWVMRDIEKALFSGERLTAEQIEKMVYNETSHAGFADRITVVNETEAAYFRKSFSKDIRVLSHAIPNQPTPATFEARQDFLFIGRLIEDNAPNVDSLVWFTEEILPKVQEALQKKVRLSIIGAIKAERIHKMASNPSVELVGPVDDITPWYDRARVFIAPTRYSAGIPLKVIESVSHGLPCVITPLLARQLGWSQEAGVLIGADAAEFARQCACLYSDAALWERVRRSGLAEIQAHYSFDTFAENIRRIVADRD